MKGNKMSYVYKPIDLVSTENNYKAYAIVIGGGKEVIFLKNSQELKELFEKCSEDELSIYALQSVVRAEKVNGSDGYDDDYCPALYSYLVRRNGPHYEGPNGSWG